MKPKLSSFIVAEGVSVDSISGRLTAFNMIDHVVVASLPCLMMRLMTVSSYELGDEADQVKERVRFVSDKGDTLIQSETDISFATRAKDQLPNRHHSMHSVWNAKMTAEGDHFVILEHKHGEAEWMQVASVCLTVKIGANPLMNMQARYPKAAVSTPNTSQE